MISISKKISVVILCIGILFANVYAIVRPTSEFYINDYAGLLSSTTEQYIVNVNVSLENQTGAQVVVVTVNNLNNMSLEEYATTLFRQFGIGNKAKNNGVLLLLALEERQFRVEVGYGLEGVLNDAKTGRIQDQYIIPYLKQNKWDEGIKNGFDAIVQAVADEYGVKVTTDQPVAIADSESEVNPLLWVVMGNFIIGAVLNCVASIKQWKKLNTFGIIMISSILFGIISWSIIPDKSLGITIVGISALIGFVIFTKFLTGNGDYRGHSGSGGRSGGFSGGGGRSGGGGSSRRF